MEIDRSIAPWTYRSAPGSCCQAAADPCTIVLTVYMIVGGIFAFDESGDLYGTSVQEISWTTINHIDHGDGDIETVTKSGTVTRISVLSKKAGGAVLSSTETTTGGPALGGSFGALTTTRTKETLTEDYDGPDGSYHSTTTLSDPLTVSDIQAWLDALLSAVDLDSMTPGPAPLFVSAGYAGAATTSGPDYDSYADIAATAVTNRDAASTARDAAVSALVDAAAAHASAHADVVAKRAALDAARTAWAHALQAVENCQGSIETYLHRGDLDSWAAAIAALPGLQIALTTAATPRDATATAYQVAVTAQETARVAWCNADRAAQAAVISLTHAEYLVTATAGNLTAIAVDEAIVIQGAIGSSAPGSGGGSGPPDVHQPIRSAAVQSYRSPVDPHYTLSNIERIKIRVAYGINLAAWAINPPQVTLAYATATYKLDSSGSGVVQAEPEVTAPQTLTLPLSDADRYKMTPAFDLSPPSDPGATFLIGAVRAPLIDLSLQILGGRNRKRGFQVYASPETPPVFYRRETATGSFPGCPLQSLPARTYTGDQVYVLTDGIVAASPTDTFSDDVTPDRRSLPPDLEPYQNRDADGDRRIHLQFAGPGEIVSPTARRWRSEVLCGGTNVLLDQMTLTLSDPYTTAALKSPIDALASAAWDSATPAPAGLESLGRFAIRRLSADETTYDRQKIRVKFFYDFFTDYDQPPYDVAPTDKLTVSWQKVTRNLVTGEVTTEAQETDLPILTDYPGGSGASSRPPGTPLPYESDWVELTADQDRQVYVGVSTLKDRKTVWDEPLWQASKATS